MPEKKPVSPPGFAKGNGWSADAGEAELGSRQRQKGRSLGLTLRERESQLVVLEAEVAGLHVVRRCQSAMAGVAFYLASSSNAKEETEIESGTVIVGSENRPAIYSVLCA